MGNQPVQLAKAGYCEYCQSQGEIGKDVFLEDKIADMEIYICKRCEDNYIQEMESYWQTIPCRCLRSDPACAWPGCRGYWS